MSFKCSIFGHSYADSEVEREREEDGSEVVITIRETETCERCGETRVISENKEVTTLETAADIVADDLEDEPDDGTDRRDAPGAAAGDSGAEATATRDTDTVPTAETQPGTTGADSPEIPDAESDSGSVEHPPDVEEDDAVILDADDDDEDGDETEAPETGRGPGEWPEEPRDDDRDTWEPSTEIDPPESQRSSVESTGEAVTVPEGEFYCPECEFTTAVESSSLREGDFCPECHQGALEHRAE